MKANTIANQIRRKENIGDVAANDLRVYAGADGFDTRSAIFWWRDTPFR